MTTDKTRNDKAVDEWELEWILGASRCNLFLLKELYHYDPDLIDLQDFFIGFTALHWAVKKGHKEIVSWLCHSNADVDIQSNGGYTPLHLAVMSRKDDMVDILVTFFGADIHLRDYSGKKPRDYLGYGSSPAIYEILEATRPPSVTNIHAESASSSDEDEEFDPSEDHDASSSGEETASRTSLPDELEQSNASGSQSCKPGVNKCRSCEQASCNEDIPGKTEKQCEQGNINIGMPSPSAYRPELMTFPGRPKACLQDKKKYHHHQSKQSDEAHSSGIGASFAQIRSVFEKKWESRHVHTDRHHHKSITDNLRRPCKKVATSISHLRSKFENDNRSNDKPHGQQVRAPRVSKSKTKLSSGTAHLRLKFEENTKTVGSELDKIKQRGTVEPVSDVQEPIVTRLCESEMISIFGTADIVRYDSSDEPCDQPEAGSSKK